ncbi:arylsulfatase [Sorangium sp. So ce542]|uniref:arylsulfatase n=1 Tax=Sorangium sp. So ce542 TaxID=3133316 RepID=UPI003F613A64
MGQQARRPRGGARARKGTKEQPNILIIMGDDIGWFNLSAYNRGMMGYETPHIDRIAREGILFTDYYGQQSCTAGRAALMTGQTPLRTGLTKVGIPGAKRGLSDKDPTIAEILQPLGYATGQFGKNHFGDRDEHLPTMHGFDEFFGNLYHLNAEEEPEHPDYPRDPGFREKFGPRGVVHSWADGRGGQRIEDTGPLTRERMETIDEEVLAATLGFIKRAHEAERPFFVWFNSTRMHVWTHLKPEAAGKTGLGVYADGMVEHDGHVGRLLSALDDLGVSGDTLVIYTTDNGAESFTWPDGGTTPFRGEKNTQYEGAYRVPCLARWPGVIAPGRIDTSIVASEDWLPTLAAAAGVRDVKKRLLTGYRAGGKTFRVHLDGYDQTALLSGAGPSARREFFYVNDEGQVVALRYDRWKVVFAEQRAQGLLVWQEPFVPLRLPKLFDLRADPFERADQGSILYDKWRIDHAFVIIPALAFARKFVASFQEFPPRQKPETWNLDTILQTMQRTPD